MMTGNYSSTFIRVCAFSYHTIPNDDRELQPLHCRVHVFEDHTIPNDDRELQHQRSDRHDQLYHTIPNDDRELQPLGVVLLGEGIIPYQMMTGNYSGTSMFLHNPWIIPYQMMTGNYSSCLCRNRRRLYHTIPNDDREL